MGLFDKLKRAFGGGQPKDEEEKVATSEEPVVSNLESTEANEENQVTYCHKPEYCVPSFA